MGQTGMSSSPGAAASSLKKLPMPLIFAFSSINKDANRIQSGLLRGSSEMIGTGWCVMRHYGNYEYLGPTVADVNQKRLRGLPKYPEKLSKRIKLWKQTKPVTVTRND